MAETNRELLALLWQVSTMQKEFELTSRLTGENFNVFDILGLSTKETRTHSAFIAELLNPSGSHGQGPLYLELFLKEISIDPSVFPLESAHVEPEKHIGSVSADGSCGGRIDILLTGGGKHIAIENKIGAKDQEKQMFRYYNYKTEGLLVLCYLTLHGVLPSKESTGAEQFEFRCISYQTNILNWLGECYKNSAGLPTIRESIFQYSVLIRRLTGLTARKNVMENTKQFIRENSEIVDSIGALTEAWNSIVKDVNERFTQLLGAAVTGKYLVADGKLFLLVWTGEDGDGRYIGLRLEDAVDEKKVVSGDILDKYVRMFRSLVKNCWRTKHCNIGWIYPDPFSRQCQKFACLPRKQILSFYDKPGALDSFVTTIKKQSDDIVASLQKI